MLDVSGFHTVASFNVLQWQVTTRCLEFIHGDSFGVIKQVLHEKVLVELCVQLAVINIMEEILSHLVSTGASSKLSIDYRYLLWRFVYFDDFLPGDMTKKKTHVLLLRQVPTCLVFNMTIKIENKKKTADVTLHTYFPQ